MKGKILTFVFVILLALCVSLAVAFPADEQSIIKENRTPAEFPAFNAETVTDGSFMKGMDTYLNDRIAYRGIFTDMSARIKSTLGMKSNLGKIIPVKRI